MLESELKNSLYYMNIDFVVQVTTLIEPSQ
jgi:hypothetical protein